MDRCKVNETITSLGIDPIWSLGRRWDYLSRDIARALLEANGPVATAVELSPGKEVYVILVKPDEEPYQGFMM